MCNTVIDNPGRIDKGKLVGAILNFLETDTVLFYGEEPPELLQSQMEKWSPIILWFRERFGVQIEPTTEVISSPVKQGRSVGGFHFTSIKVDIITDDLRILEKYLQSYDVEALQGFAFCADALKSLILTVACVERRLSVRHSISKLKHIPVSS